MLLGSGQEFGSGSIRWGGKVCNGDDLVCLLEFIKVGSRDFRDGGK